MESASEKSLPERHQTRNRFRANGTRLGMSVGYEAISEVERICNPQRQSCVMDWLRKDFEMDCKSVPH